MNLKNLRLLLVDDHQILREGIRSCLAPFPDIEIAGEASDGAEAVRKAMELQVDVVLMDINMPDMNGLEALELLQRDVPQAKVLILTVHNNPEYVRRTIRSGARGYLLKDASPSELARAVRLVGEGKSFFSPEVNSALLEMCSENNSETEVTPTSLLSEREREVLKLVASGRSTKEIATELDIAFRTVETHRERLMRKLQIHNIAGLTRFAIANGIVDLR
jgi:two-component system, NarL family, nitrate/nitrite response regulator NarL